jgi:Tfp pilus assembly protein PilZ
MNPMDNNYILNSIGIGGAIFVGLLLFWFVSMYLKKRYTSDQSARGYTPSTQISWKEKRRHPRMAVSWDATIGISPSVDKVQLKDISLGGAFVVCAKPLNLNDRLRITLQIPARDSLCLNAEVVWSNVNVPEERVVNRGMGIRFIDNEEKDRHKLNEALSAAFKNGENDI